MPVFLMIAICLDVSWRYARGLFLTMWSNDLKAVDVFGYAPDLSVRRDVRSLEDAMGIVNQSLVARGDYLQRKMRGQT